MPDRLDLTGIIPAPHTPIYSDGSLWYEVIPDYVNWLLDQNVRAVFVGGSTGESMSLSTQERMELVDAWIDASDGRLPVIVHVGHTSVPDCQAMAEHAAKVGAIGIGAMGPCYFKPTRADDLVDFCAEVASAAPSLPFFYYHIPSMTGVNVRMIDFLRAAQGRIPTLAGLKYTHDDAMDFAQCLRYMDGKYTCIWGKDEVMMTALAMGATSFIGSTYNYMSPLYHRLIAAFHAGDLETARLEQSRSASIVEILLRYGPTPASKAVLGLCGMDVGPARLPLRALSDGEIEAIRKAVEELGLFGWRL